MTKKVTLSVSDELSEKMEKWKDSFNFSGIFQEAITEAIQRKEDFQKRLKEDPKMNEIIERLRKEKAESEKEWFEIGKTEGLEWAKVSSYDELQIVLTADGDEIPMDLLNKNDDVNEEWFQEQVYDYYVLPRDTIADTRFQAGFMRGVREFWKEVANKI
jgi:hypothetical protein